MTDFTATQSTDEMAYVIDMAQRKVENAMREIIKRASSILKDVENNLIPQSHDAFTNATGLAQDVSAADANLALYVQLANLGASNLRNSGVEVTDVQSVIENLRQ